MRTLALFAVGLTAIPATAFAWEFPVYSMEAEFQEYVDAEYFAQVIDESLYFEEGQIEVGNRGSYPIVSILVDGVEQIHGGHVPAGFVYAVQANRWSLHEVIVTWGAPCPNQTSDAVGNNFSCYQPLWHMGYGDVPGNYTLDFFDWSAADELRNKIFDYTYVINLQDVDSQLTFDGFGGVTWTLNGQVNQGTYADRGIDAYRMTRLLDLTVNGVTYAAQYVQGDLYPSNPNGFVINQGTLLVQLNGVWGPHLD